MRKIFILLVIGAFCTIGCRKELPAGDSPVPNVTTKAAQGDSGPQYAACVTCFIGEIGSGSNCTGSVFQPGEKTTDFKATQKLSCGHPGRVSEIEWNFIEHKDDKDLYRFKRTFPVDTDECTTASSIIGFDGTQIIIFQDEHQVIVMDTPKREP